MRVAVLLALPAICGCAYKPGSYHHVLRDFPGERATAGCLDVAIERRPDPYGGGTILGYSFGNRCDHPAVVDLAHVQVTARTVDGVAVRLEPYDPRGELEPLQIDGRLTGNEAIEYPQSVPLAEVCVDVASISHAAPEKWVCFDNQWSRRQRGLFAGVQ